ncbi:hypothetical protein ACS0PU_010212 [Formica fusca]
MLAQLSSTGAGYTVGLLGWTRIHVGHGGSRARLAYTTLPSHAFHAASRKHRRLAAAASSRNPYLYWECEENRHKGVHFAQQRVNGSGVVGYRSGQTQKDEISSINRRMKPTVYDASPRDGSPRGLHQSRGAPVGPVCENKTQESSRNSKMARLLSVNTQF